MLKRNIAPEFAASKLQVNTIKNQKLPQITEETNLFRTQAPFSYKYKKMNEKR